MLSLVLESDAFSALFGDGRGRASGGDLRRFATLAAFHADDPQRASSDESDFGVHWLGADDSRFPRWRMSYVARTGELYVVRLQPGLTRDGERDTVIILGVITPDCEPQTPGRCWYETVERTLDGWTARCGEPGGLAWVAAQLRDRDTPRS